MKGLCILFVFAFHWCTAQTVQLVASGNKTSLRGLSVVNDRIAWVCGSQGVVAYTLNGGVDWKWMVVGGYESRDFRDIEAFDGVTAIIIAVGEPAVILKTINGGETWKVVYHNAQPGMFLDAMEFWNEQSGIVLGDPIDGRFFIARTFDEGNTWHHLPVDNLPKADSGEACFAASGTNIRKLDRDEACFVSGGTRSRLFWKGDPIDIPIIQGRETTGANSVAVRDARRRKRSTHLVIVGGDFARDSLTRGNCVITYNTGKDWIIPNTPPHGYRSCVEYISKSQLIACGTTGVDISNDGGMNWSLISTTGFHVCRKAKEGRSVFLAGSGGRIAKLFW